LLQSSIVTEAEIPILFESTGLIAVDKPEGVASIPERGGKGDDLLSRLTRQTGMRLFVVHRLDKGVTGVIIYAKNADAHRFLNDQFAARATKKRYMALVQGVVKEDEGTVQTPLRKFGSGRMGVDESGGMPSETRFKVVERFPCYTLLGVNPLSGRRHQIRVHLYSIKHAVAGDRLYGDQRFQKPFPRIMLHARELEIEMEPGKPVLIEARLPESFTSVVNNIRGLQKPLTGA
jgi:tRNA pseudouridine32 synthase / 23S rRNA pseudouridine746 synthase